MAWCSGETFFLSSFILCVGQIDSHRRACRLNEPAWLDGFGSARVRPEPAHAEVDLPVDPRDGLQGLEREQERDVLREPRRAAELPGPSAGHRERRNDVFSRRESSLHASSDFFLHHARKKNHDRQLCFLVAETRASVSLARARRDAEPDVFASATDDTRVSLDADPSSRPPRASEPPAGPARRPSRSREVAGKTHASSWTDAFARSTRRRHAAPRGLRGVARGARAGSRSRRCHRPLGRRYHQAHRTSNARPRRKP